MCLFTGLYRQLINQSVDFRILLRGCTNQWRRNLVCWWVGVNINNVQFKPKDCDRKTKPGDTVSVHYTVRMWQMLSLLTTASSLLRAQHQVLWVIKLPCSRPGAACRCAYVPGQRLCHSLLVLLKGTLGKTCVPQLLPASPMIMTHPTHTADHRASLLTAPNSTAA